MGFLELLPIAISILGKQGWFGDTGGGTQKVTQKPMILPEQENLLRGLAGDMAGKPRLGKMYNQLAGLGAGEIKKLLGTEEYDPYSQKGLYSGLKREILRQQREQQDILNREAARTGALSSTWRGKETGLLAERTQNKLADILAGLYDTFTQRKLQAAQVAENIAQQKYNQWLKGKGLQLQIATAGIPYGVKELPVYRESPWTRLLNQAIFQTFESLGQGG